MQKSRVVISVACSVKSGLFVVGIHTCRTARSIQSMSEIGSSLLGEIFVYCSFMDTLKLEKIASNLHTVQVGSLTLYYSYQTVVAYRFGGRLYMSKNVWSRTTGKHLNIIDRYSERMDQTAFLSGLEETLRAHGLSERMYNMV